MTSTPLVSVVICTRDRPARLERALASVLAQNVTDYEVLVVGDGFDATASPIATRPPVRWLATAPQLVGAARGLALQEARGALVAYCDDDDTWTANHLSTLCAALEADPSIDLVYGDAEWTSDGRSKGVPYSFDFDPTTLAGKNYIFASDVVHRTEAARRAGGFDPRLSAYEDWDLWLRMAVEGRRFRHVPVVLGTHEWHSGCVGAVTRHDESQRVYARHQARARGVECPPPFRPETWTSERRELIWYSLVDSAQGYGKAARELVKALAAEGIEIVTAPIMPRGGVDPAWQHFARPWDHWGRFGFYYHHDSRLQRMPCERLIRYWMWESTAIPQDQVTRINSSVSLQYVPCRQNLEAFAAAGVRVPMKVLHHGVDPEQFPLLVRERRDVFTFGSFGDLTSRKGIDVLIRAFEDEFGRREPVRLVLKDSAETPLLYETRDSRIEFLREIFDHQPLLEFLRRLDAFVLPSRGEGFGLCGIEAMATGLPLIATAWSGPTEYFDPADSYPLSYRLADPQRNQLHLTEPGRVRFHGLWAEPDYEHLRALLRHVYEHPDEAAAKGRSASARVVRDFTWQRVGRQVRDDIDELAGISQV
jgi:glycosyltransferase involved in cell wall biosynthesis